MKGPDNVIRVSTSLKDFFKAWLTFLAPYHKMTGGQIEVASKFLFYWYKFNCGRKLDADSLGKEVLGECVRKKVREECGITTSHFLVTMSALRKKGFIVNGSINPRYIPSLHMDINDKEGDYTLMLYFQLENELTK
jgi:hypothetical protein